MRVSELRNLDIINIEDGRRWGPLLDLDVDLEKGYVKGILVAVMGRSGSKGFLNMSRGDEVLIAWDKVLKIGVDVILVDGRE